MPGYKVLTNLAPDRCLKAAWRAAQDCGFRLKPLADGATQFRAKKGHWALNVLAGNLFTPRCDIKVSTQQYDNGTEVVLEMDVPWVTTGALGVRRANNQATALVDAIAETLKKEGGEVIERKEF